MSDREGTQRALRRQWNRRKSHIPKHSSLPELQLIPRQRPLFHCRRCGFTNTLLPLCLWCTWSSQEAEHEFKSSMPRPRRVSAPCRVLFQAEFTRSHHPAPHDRHKAASCTTSIPNNAITTSTKKTRSTAALREPAKISHSQGRPRLVAKVGTMCDQTSALHSDGGLEPAETPILAKVGVGAFPNGVDDEAGVSTATDKVQAAKKGDRLSDNRLRLAKFTSKLGFPTESRPFTPPRVDRRLSESMTVTKPSKNLNPKPSHRVLIIDFVDTKLPQTGHEDTSNRAAPSSPNKPESPRRQHIRPLRRKNHLNIVQMSTDDPDAEPISISLNLHRPSSPSPVKSTLPPIHTHSTSTYVAEPVTPPSITSPLSPPSTSPSGLSTSPNSSPIRLGHPSRPYYSAIRKGGISPPPSRPTSIGAHPLSGKADTRPQSFTPPSSFHFEQTGLTAASRHLSLSSAFVPPSYLSSPSGVFSAFSLVDDNDDSESWPIAPPTPHPNLSRFSLPSNAKPLVHNTFSQMSPTKASKAGRRSGVGFSMSGETELRMALASLSSETARPTSAGGGLEDGFMFRDTSNDFGLVGDVSRIVQPQIITAGRLATRRGGSTPAAHPGRGVGSGFMGRVRKLRDGIKEMLLLSNHSTTTTAAASTS